MVIPSSFKMKCADVWLEARVKKEAWLMWVMWHQVIVMNVWHARINQEVATTCQSCNQDTPQTVVHRFWDYPKAKAAWEWAFTIIHSLSDPPQRRRKKRPLMWRNAYSLRSCLRPIGSSLAFGQ
jgi:hypothetical protein